MTTVTMTVNGRQVSGEVEPRTLLVEFIRYISASPARMSAATPASAGAASSMSTASR